MGFRPHFYMATVEEKYAYLLKHLKITDIDWWESDALLVMPDKIYFQFPSCWMNDPTLLTVDAAIEAAMDDWYRRSIGEPDGTK